MRLKWTDVREIAIELDEAHPDVDPRYVNFVDLRDAGIWSEAPPQPEDPVEAAADHEHHVGLRECGRAGGIGEVGMVVAHHAAGHGRRHVGEPEVHQPLEKNTRVALEFTGAAGGPPIQAIVRIVWCRSEDGRTLVGVLGHLNVPLPGALYLIFPVALAAAARSWTETLATATLRV